MGPMTIPERPASAPATPETAPRRRSWWRSNAVALITLAVLLPGTAAAVLWQGWHEYYGYGSRPYSPILVAEDGEAEFIGATFGPIRSSVIEDLSGLDVPEGATLIAAAIPVDAGSEGVSCDVVLVQQSTGREWTTARTEIGLLPDTEEPESCTTADTGSYEVIAPFVVPDDVEGPFWVDVRSLSSESEGAFLRFPVDP